MSLTLWHTIVKTVGFIYYSKPANNKIESNGKPDVVPDVIHGPQTKEEVLHMELKDRLTDIRKEDSIGDLNDSWVFLLSQAEEMANKQDEARAREIKNELQRIQRVSSTIKQRPRLASYTTNFWNKMLSSETRIILENSRLDASKRDRIIRDAVRTVSLSWLIEVQTLLPENSVECFTNRWYEQAYKKNILGEISSLCFLASNPATQKGLNSTLLSEILWSAHLSLSREIANELNAPLTDEQLEVITQVTEKLAPEVVTLWEKTTQAAGSIALRESQLPALWEEQRKQEERRIAQIKEAGVTARYNDGSDDVLLKSKREKKQAHVLTESTYTARRDHLAANLCLGGKPGGKPNDKPSDKASGRPPVKKLENIHQALAAKLLTRQKEKDKEKVD